ncbi:hypothetical protein RB195_024911 [Necator americanus]|uniref:WAP domain-containing protein n=1 Tax=Necator americanus TaxID=51031 RepID=A0ABR1ES96_NECAM
MTCFATGFDHICCKRWLGTQYANNTNTTSQKVSRNENDKVLECPQNSIGLIDRKGLPVLCNSTKRCSRNAFCHTVGSRSICCERYEFASNALEHSVTPPPALILPSVTIMDLTRSNNSENALKIVESATNYRAEKDDKSERYQKPFTSYKYSTTEQRPS